jgi:F-type H+-transporting ATPase subunit epsilon
MPIRCEIVSQDRIVFSGDADSVLIPGAEGYLGVLPHHTPVLTIIQFGVITVTGRDGVHHIAVSGGVAEVQPDQVTILADAAENVSEIDIQRADSARQRAEELLKQGIPQDSDSYLKVQAALRRSNLRLDAVRRFRRDH